MSIDDIKQIKPDKEENNKDKTSDEKDPKDTSGEEMSIPNLGEKNKTSEGKKATDDKSKLTFPEDASGVEKLYFWRRWSDERKRKARKVLIGTGIFSLILLIALVIPSFFVYQKAKAFYQSSLELKASIQGQNLQVIRTELQEAKEDQRELKNTYRFISWTKFIPFFGNYTRDGQRVINAAGHGLEAGEILIDTAEPYADILGFTGDTVLGEASDGEKTAQERIDFVVQTLPDLVPKIDAISQKVGMARAEIEKINPSRYPVRFAGREVRSNVRRGVDLVVTADKFIKDGKPLLEQAPYLLGLDEPRTYFVLFQNDKELRPTGGFLTAYSIMTVDKARFEPTDSNDIYTLDALYTPTVESPEPIVRYLEGPYVLDEDLRLRDMNWNPDFEESMELFTREAEKVGIEDIDGIIAVDTQLLVNLLDVIGPIGVPGYGNFSTETHPECNCPQVIYELESFADVEGPIVWDPVSGEIVFRPANSDNRKAIIGPLMNSIMANALGQPKENIGPLFEAGFRSLIEKHVLFFVFDEDAQNAVESFNIAGKIKDYDGDYLHINDSNLGGRKSNLYVTQEVEQQVEVLSDGSLEKTVTITYNNPEEHDGWLNSVLPNWVRIYVPEGSELIDFSGVEDREDPYVEHGKTVYAGYFELRPQGIAKVTVQYRVPGNFKEDYNLLIQKQPGKDKPLYLLEIGRHREEFFLRTDEEIKLPL